MTAQHLLVLRHGETKMSTTGVYTSRTDVPLSARGRASASSWHPFLNGVRAMVSPLVRACETAELAGLKMEPVDDLKEWDLGNLEGRPSEGFRLAHPDWNLFRDGAPGGEQPKQVMDRVGHVVQRVQEVDDQLLVLTGHGQFSKALATALLRLHLETASRFVWGPGRAALFSWRSSLGDYVLAGWNRTPQPLEQLLEGNS